MSVDLGDEIQHDGELARIFCPVKGLGGVTNLWKRQEFELVHGFLFGVIQTLRCQTNEKHELLRRQRCKVTEGSLRMKGLKMGLNQ
jgi:hypothetical protein